MARRVGHLEDALLGQQRLDLVARDDVALLQRFDGEILARVAVLRENDLRSAIVDQRRLVLRGQTVSCRPVQIKTR